MAFYSVRVNESGAEIEPPRTLNLSKLTYRGGDQTDNEDVSARSSVRNFPLRPQKPANSSSTADNLNSYKRVRYVNSAAFIEKEVENPKRQVVVECEDLQLDSHRSSIMSDDDDEISNHQYQSHIIMGNDLHIPMLELNSNESFPSSNETSYSYSKIQEVTKIIQKPDAYKEWIRAKKISKTYAEQRKKAEEDKKEKEKQERKEVAEKKYKEWLNKKVEKKVLKEKKADKKEEKVEVSVQEPKANNNLSPAEKERCFKLWLKNKREKEKQSQAKRKEKILHEEERREERKKQAEILYNEWLKTAPLKPKPVPLNQGLFTFKGTISDIYVNPEPWCKENADDENTNSL